MPVQVPAAAIGRERRDDFKVIGTGCIPPTGVLQVGILKDGPKQFRALQNRSVERSTGQSAPRASTASRLLTCLCEPIILSRRLVLTSVAWTMVAPTILTPSA